MRKKRMNRLTALCMAIAVGMPGSVIMTSAEEEMIPEEIQEEVVTEEEISEPVEEVQEEVTQETVEEVQEQVEEVKEEIPEPVEEAQPEPVEEKKEETPEPTETVTPEPTETVTPEPTETVTPEPIQTVQPEPTPEKQEEVKAEPEKQVEEETEIIEETVEEEKPDTNADLETEEDWKKTLPEKLAHEENENPKEADYRNDMVEIARSQIGYKESEKNYVDLEANQKAHYSRYAAWSGGNYAQYWDAEFIGFVMNYAGVNAPYNSDTVQWTYKLNEEGLYFSHDYNRKPGDVIFILDDDGTFHAGIVEEVDKEENKVKYIAGTVNEEINEIKEFEINADDDKIFAYALVVKRDLSEQMRKATVYEDKSMKHILKDITISVEGYLPNNAEVLAWPVMVDIKGEKTFAAYQIKIMDSDNKQFHSSEDTEAIIITINDPELTKILEEQENVRGWRKDGDQTENMNYEILEDGSVRLIANKY